MLALSARQLRAQIKDEPTHRKLLRVLRAPNTNANSCASLARTVPPMQHVNSEMKKAFNRILRINFSWCAK